MYIDGSNSSMQKVTGRYTLAEYVVWFEHLGMGDVDRVGGKNASLGEMISHYGGCLS